MMIAENITTLVAMVNFSSLVLLSFLIISNPLRVNRTGNLCFGIFLFFWASFWSDELVLMVYGEGFNLYWKFVLRFPQYFTPMLFYFSVVFYSNPDYRIRKLLLLHLILPFAFFVVLYYYFFVESQPESINYALFALMMGQTLFYTLASYIRIKRHRKNILMFSSQTSEVDLSWLERIVVVMFLIVLLVIIYNVVFSLKALNLFMNIILLAVIYDVAFHSLKQKEIYPFSETSRVEIIALNEETGTKDLKKRLVTDDELVLIKSRLNQFMISRKPYLDPDLNLVKLAEQFGTSPHRLSYIINAGFNRNFFNFTNSYRVDEAKALLLSHKMEQYSVLGIAFESGFNSKTSFNNTFKKITGLTPSEFRKSGSTL
jgi:AraC-like DNA-binding protein